ncbi:30S ribosomal protein S18 [bacterium (Candidatus Howlettbacteria) CG_4_10_14_0_8_um_filter_40_9]|nr:MAG: 30S ribosomal protein S18 [bacterium (Candidatus Howlettbacteria) CG_4_10_14_0_8_um_filter_40_9]
MEYIAKKKCKFCEENIDYIDYKDVKSLQRFVSGYSKINSRKRNGNCMKHQRMVSRAVKRARILALISFVPR